MNDILNPLPAAGVLLHVSSLPGRFGIGDCGPRAERFLQWAAEAGQSVWQILPLGPPGSTHSPYDAFSAFAGNPLFISPERLVEDGLVPRTVLDEAPSFPPGRASYARVARWKDALHRRAWARFGREAPIEARDRYEAFVERSRREGWMDDWVLFSAIKAKIRGRRWTAWRKELRERHPAALAAARRRMEPACAYHRFLQFLFFDQWERLRSFARGRGIRILGDLPMYVSHDSADVWANAALFDLDARGRPLRVAGVPPDAFSATGQHWGNPLYRWDRMRERGYAWWIARIRANLTLADAVRLDHFRGFAAYWEIPAGAATAEGGRWVPGPGASLFAAIRSALGEVPLLAEDLGHITPDVVALKEGLGLMGMRVLQFGIEGPDGLALLEGIDGATVVYTGTHDNDTSRGWFESLDADSRRRVLRRLDSDDSRIVWDLLGAAYRTRAAVAIAPLQDMLDLGSEARMNTPGRARGNWLWRVSPGTLGTDLAARLRALAEETGRMPSAPQAAVTLPSGIP